MKNPERLDGLRHVAAKKLYNIVGPPRLMIMIKLLQDIILTSIIMASDQDGL